MTAWAESIRKGESTVEYPSASVVDKIAQMKAKGHTSKGSVTNIRRTRMEQGGMYFAPVLNIGGTTSSMNNESVANAFNNAVTGASNGVSNAPPSSSPSRWTDEPTADVSVEVEAFFKWLGKQKEFSKKPTDIANMMHVIIEEKDMDLPQLYRMSADV
jgi:hypothetical protein